ncbi:MAG: permease [Chloroflexi bacterium]|nr:permease [Chloroflexota bacterium]
MPFGPIMAFLISSPLLDLPILGVLVYLMGLKVTAIYGVIAFLGSMLLAALFSRFGFHADVIMAYQESPPEEDLESVPQSTDGIVGGGPSQRVAWSRSLALRVVQAWRAAWRQFWPLAPRIAVGAVIGVSMARFMPAGWLHAVGGPDQSFAVPLMAALGFPLHLNAEVLLPVTSGLLSQGVQVGAVVALMVTGLGTSITQLTLLPAFFRPRTIAALWASVYVMAVVAGTLATLVEAS